MLAILNVEWRPGWPRWSGFDKEDLWLGVFILCVAALGALAVAITDLENTEAVSGWLAWSLIIALPLAAYVALSLFVIGRRWDATHKDDAPGTEEQPAFHTAFLFLFLLLAVLAWIAFGPNVPFAAWPWPVDLTHPVQRSIYLGAIGAGFLPLLYGFHLVATEAGGKGHRNYFKHPEGPVSMATLLGGVALIGAIGTGAWAAGEQVFSMEQNFGLVIMALVVMGFLAFIFLPHLSSLIGEREDTDKPDVAHAGFAMHPGYLVSGLDAAMVRLLAPLSGATQGGLMVPQLILLLIMLPLSAMGYALPHPWGLAPIAIASLIIFGLGRRWAWVEDDREKALRIQTTRSDQFRIGFANDLRDEALMGYAWLFVLVPLALRQIQMHFDLFEPVDPMILAGAAQSTGLIEWLKFFGTELAKGVPIVDWVDIYDVTQEEPFIPKGAAARHIVFISRLLVDVVLIAALLQAFGIMQRNKAQKRLFEAGQIDFFDPFLESHFFRQAHRGTDPVYSNRANVSDKFSNLLASHVEKSIAQFRGGVPYSLQRLNELISSKSEHERQVANWVVWKYDLLVGSVEDRMGRLEQRWSDILELPEALEQWDENPQWRNRQRMDFERILNDARFERTDYWREPRSKSLSALLKHVHGKPDFIEARKAAYAILSTSPSLHAVRALAARVISPEVAETLPQMSKESALAWSFEAEPKDAERALALDSLGDIVELMNTTTLTSKKITRAFVEAVCEHVLTTPGKMSQAAARRVLDKLKGFKREI
ncbi:hypothetical protein [Hyphomonas oceanitis]|uniref:hypothetical protein n=1 Tax=Hyphomonas oceanitis TaxID=81033 RepID=UPI003001848B